MSCYNVESLESILQMLCNILITSAKKRDKVSLTIASSNFIYFLLFGCTLMI